MKRRLPLQMGKQDCGAALTGCKAAGVGRPAALPVAAACLLLMVCGSAAGAEGHSATTIVLDAPDASLMPSAGTALTSIVMNALPNQQPKVSLRLSAPAPRPSAFVLKHPARIVIDLPDTRLKLSSDHIAVHLGGIESILAAAGAHRSRLVLTLDRPRSYKMRWQGDEVTVTLGPPVNTETSPQSPEVPLSELDGDGLRLVGTVRPWDPSAAIASHTSAQPLDAQTLADASAEWGAAGIAPALLGENGEVLYAYGENRPTVTCAPLRLCVINLLPGDQIVNIAIGDSVRWLAQAVHAGEQDSVVLKPVEAGLKTNLMVAATGRNAKGHLYYLTLVSDTAGYVPMVGFYDPTGGGLGGSAAATPVPAAESPESPAQGNSARRSVTHAVRDEVVSVELTHIDFGYVCRPDGHFSRRRRAEAILPERVFADGGHTYVEMPPDIGYHDLPALFGFEGKTYLLNSRFENGYFVVDSLPQELRLVDGEGKDAASVTCRHVNGGLKLWSH